MSSAAPNPDKPYAIVTACAIMFEKIGCINIDVQHWCEEGALVTGSVVFVSGDLFFPPGDDEGRIDANQMRVLVEAEDAGSLNILSAPAHVSAIGVVKSVIERSWNLEVGFYDRVVSSCYMRAPEICLFTYSYRILSASQKIFNVEITVPDTKRFEKLKAPKLDRLVSVRGTLASISVNEKMAGIELESVTFISMTGGVPSNGGGSPNVGTGSKSKRQFCAEQVVSPVKKVKVGPASAFIGKEAAKDLISA